MTQHIEDGLTVDRALSDGLAWLMEQCRTGLHPDQARRRLSELQKAHPAIDIDLVWEQEDYSEAVHYDLLMRANDEGTISLSFSPDRAVPWPLRNAYRTVDRWVVRVNGRVIDAATAMTTMDVIWDRTELVQGLVNLGLIDEAVTRRGLTVSAAEIQEAMNAFRRKNRLWTKEDTTRYMEAHGLTQRDLERRLESQAMSDKLRDAVTQGKLEQYFEDHRADYETAHVARFRVSDEAAANRIAASLRERQTNFFDAARTQFLEGSSSGPTFAVLRRGALTAQQAEVVFSAAPGDYVVAPAGQACDVVQVLRIERALWDESTQAQVREAVFNAWLAEGRRNAQITWFWGDPHRLENQNAGWAS